MKITKISKDVLIPTIWNGGETFEYFIFPKNSSYVNRDFSFRISAATINKVPSTFTKFKNYQRFLVMMDSDLHINNNGKEEHYTPNDVFKFDSESDITSYTKGNDFNLMVRNDIDNIDVFLMKDIIELSESMVLVFAKTTTILSINNTEFFLQPEDLLTIDNKNLDKIAFETNQTVIIGCFTEKNK